jgi:hypothetical protein
MRQHLNLGTVILLIASLCNAQTQAADTEIKGDARLYSRIIRAEMKAGGLAQHNTVCLALPHYSDPSKSLLKALKSDGLIVNKPAKCLFRGYEVRLEESARDSIRVQLVDVRYADTDLAVILRDGIYAIEKDTAGYWDIGDYKPIWPLHKK